jgi:hypothetical protein
MRQGRREESTILPPPKTAIADDRRDGDEPRDPRTADGASFGDSALLRFLAEQQACGGKQQKSSERIKNPVETINEVDTSRDHDSAHNERAKHAVEKHAVLIDFGYRELAKDQCKDEEVID